MDRSQSPAVPPGDSTAAGTFAHRYAIGDELGRGGMAVVHAATDIATGQKLAVKRLVPREHEASYTAAVSLFEQEFHVLSELVHPHVVAVSDYGVADDTPYYTMELLDGGDLAQHSPMPAAQVCGVFRDVCSVLALLHSRRLVYRDLNPRNVRCTGDGSAKLIDFGAMVPMGPAPKLIGTLGFIAPEFLNHQFIDGRVDLYAVGACMYYALTRRPPHRARSFIELAAKVLIPPPLPSEVLGSELPEALEELVMELLHPDPAFRPASAAEVIERLTAIGRLPDDEQLPVAGAYLVTPPLVGRETALAEVRKRVHRLSRRKGATLVFEAAGGAGRTRMLDAAGLEAKLAGVMTLRADASDAQAGDYGVADALAGQLLELHPDAAPLARGKAGVLAHALPSVRRAHPDVALATFDDVRNRRPAVQTALRAWLLSLAKAQSLAIVVDDVERIDEPSLALLALLAAEDRSAPLLLLLSTQLGAECASPSTLAALRDRARVLTLENLSSEDTRRLLSATFGDSAKLSLLSDRIFSVCQGKPRDVMQLAQFVVNQGLARYEGGRWLLPQKLDANVLPRSAEEASVRILAGLTQPARDLARLLAVRALPALTFEDFVDLRRNDDRAGTLRALGELAQADIVRVTETRYSLGNAMWAEAILGDLPPAELQALHARLAAFMRPRAHSPLLRQRHLQRAGDTETAVTELVEFCRESIQQTDGNPDAYHALVESLPEGWYALFDWAINAAIEQQRPLADVCVVRQRLVGFLGLDPTVPSDHAAALLLQLRHDVGLDLYEALSEEQPDPAARLKQALETAQARFEAAREDERWLAPLAAIRTLLQTQIAVAGLVVASMDYELLALMPDLRPIEAFSPAITAVRLLIEGLRQRMAGRPERAEAVYDELLGHISGPDNGGIDPTHAAYTRFGVLRGLGMLDAGIGRDRALERVEALEQFPVLSIQTKFIRILHCYFDGRARDGDAFKRELVLERIGTSAVQWHEGSHLPAEVVAHVKAQDLTRLRETVRELEVHAGRHVGWQPVLRYGEAELLRLQGKHARAALALSAELETLAAGKHQIWCHMAGAHVAVLSADSRSVEAVECGERYLAQARAAEQGINEVFIRLPLAAARLAARDLDGAWSELEGIFELLASREVRGLLLGAAHETAAQVALARGDAALAHVHIEACEAHLRADENRGGRARGARLRRAMVELTGEPGLEHRTDVDAVESHIRSEILRTCRGTLTSEAWHDALLSRMVVETDAECGAMFTRAAPSAEPELSVAHGAGEHLEVMRQLASAFYRRHDEMLSETQSDLDTATQTSIGDSGITEGSFIALPLGHVRGETLRLTSVVVLRGARAMVRPEFQAAMSRLLEAFASASG